MATFINLTNHPSASWSERQMQAAQEYGLVLDLPFPQIATGADSAAIDWLVSDYFERIRAADAPVVLVQGEHVFVYRLVHLLEQAKIPALACISLRRVHEIVLPNGVTQKTACFSFEGFRSYW